MPPASSAQEPPPTASLPRPPPRHGAHDVRLATGLAATALAIAVVAVGIAFLVPGPAGPQGSIGTGPPNVAYFAVVTDTGTLSRSSGVFSASQLGVGEYQITFITILYGCTFAVNLGAAGAVLPPAGTAVVAPPATSGSTVKVTTYNATGVVTSEGFDLGATCPGGLDAVVASNGSFVSGAGVDSSAQYGTGVYHVVFDQIVTTCAYLAGPGETFGGSPPPGFVTVAELGGHANGVFVTTYSASGVLANASFHLTVDC